MVHSRHLAPASPTQKSVGKIELGIPEDDIVVIYVGRIVEEKGVLDLFQAIEEISKNITNISVVFVGGVLPSDRDQQTYTHLKSLTSCSRVNYIFTGFVDDPLPFYRASDIFCLPSWREGLPTTLIEAALCDLDIVATDIRGSREIMKLCGKSDLAKPNDHKSLQACLIKAINRYQKWLISVNRKHLLPVMI